jgi:putative ABC transport system ATP-binding protein
VIVSNDERLREVADRVLWLEDGRLKALDALVSDPVCGMLLDPSQAPAPLEEAGSLVYFCSLGCRDEYEQAGPPELQNTPKGYSVANPRR